MSGTVTSVRSLACNGCILFAGGGASRIKAWDVSFKAPIKARFVAEWPPRSRQKIVVDEDIHGRVMAMVTYSHGATIVLHAAFSDGTLRCGT